jgi:hypothetical protein
MIDFVQVLKPLSWHRFEELGRAIHGMAGVYW